MLEDLLLQLFDAAGALVGRHVDHVVGDVDLGLDDAVPALVHRQPAAVPLGQIQPALASGVLLEDVGRLSVGAAHGSRLRCGDAF